MKLSSNKQIFLIITVCFFSLIIYFKTSTDPIAEIIKGSNFEVFFYQFNEGNNLLNNLSLGILGLVDIS